MNQRTIRRGKGVYGGNESKDYQGKEKGLKEIFNQRAIRGERK